MLHKPLVVIKLGGSALTDKTKIYTPRMPQISNASRQVSKICKHRSVVLVHGAGSFGHIPVRKFGLQRGLKSKKQLAGLAATKLKLLEWESILDKALHKHGVPSIPFLASDYVVTKNGRIISAELDPLKNWLRLGCVPSIGGDIVPDIKKGISILSGDQIAAHLAIKLNATKLLYGVDVDGVFDSNPNLNPHAHFLELLTERSAARLVSKVRSGTTPDVTGGMAGKIREAIPAARHQIPVYFVNLTKGDRLLRVATGRRALCSKLLPS